MANYAAALGKLAAEKSSEAVSGFARGVKQAALSEMPALTGAVGFASTLKKYAGSKDKEAKAEVESVKEQRTNNVISLEMVKQLRAVNANISAQIRLAAKAEQRANAAAAFAEESEREKALRDKELLDAIKKLQGGPMGGQFGADGDGGGFFGKLLSKIITPDVIKRIAEAAALYGLGRSVLNRIPGPGGPGKTSGPGGPGRTPPTTPSQPKAPAPTSSPIPQPTPSNQPKPQQPQTPPRAPAPAPTSSPIPQPAPSNQPKQQQPPKPPGNVIQFPNQKIPPPPDLPSGGSGGSGILKSLGSVARVLGWAGLAIGAILEVPGFIKDIKDWWKGPKWGGWNEPSSSQETSSSPDAAGDAGSKPAASQTTGTKSPGTKASSSQLTWSVPITGKFVVTSPFGVERPTGTHKGVDLAPAVKNSTAFAIAATAGTITEVGSGPGYGNYVKISHGDGITSLYGHLSGFSKGVYKGRKVDAGFVLGNVGNTGRSTGTHLHFEIAVKGTQQDPANYIPSLRAGKENEKPVAGTSGDNPGDNRGSAQRYGSGPPAPPGGGGSDGPTSRGLSLVPSSSVLDTGDETSRLLARYSGASIDTGDETSRLLARYPGASGTQLQKYVDFEEGERLAKQFYRNTELIVKNTGKTARAVEVQNKLTGITGGARPGSEVPAKVDPVQRYYNDKMNSLAKQFETTTNRLINTTITKALFPGGKITGITKEQANRPGFVGDLVMQNMQFQKNLTPTMNRIFGKQFGGQYASMFAQAGGLIADKGLNYLGSMLPFQNNAFSFQQIAGNLLAKGKTGAAQRKLGREQLIYGLTGIPTGATTGLNVLQKFTGLIGNLKNGKVPQTPSEQIQGLTETIMNTLGLGEGKSNNIMSSKGLLGNILGFIPPGNQTLNKVTTYEGLPMTRGDANVLKVQKGFTHDSFETATNQQEGFFNQLGTGLSKVFNSVGGGLADVMSGLMGGNGLGGILNWGFNLLASLFSGGGGGTTTGGGGGGFFEDLSKAWSGEMSWGDAILNTGMKVSGNLLTNYAAYKITKDIDNPYLKLAAQQGVNYALKSGLQLGAGALGYGDIAAKFLGKDTGLTTALKTGDFSSLNPFKTGGPSGYGPGEVGLAGPGTNITMPGSTGISTAYNDFGTATTDLTAHIEPGTTSMYTGATPLSGFGADFSGSFTSGTLGGLEVLGEGGGAISSAAASSVGDAAALGMDSAISSAGTSVLGDLAGTVSDVLPYANAIYKLFQGDIVGAAGSAAGGYLGTFLTPWLGPLGPILGSWLGGMIGGKPDPRVTWAVYVNNNNDPTAGGIISEGKKTPQQMKDAARKIGVMLFAMIKKTQLALGGISLAYDYFVIELHGKAKTAFLFVGKGGVNPHGDKKIWEAPIEGLEKKETFNSMAESLLNAMTEQTTKEKAAAAKASVSKLTKSELETGNVIGSGTQIKTLTGEVFANKFQQLLKENYREAYTENQSDGEGGSTGSISFARKVYDARILKAVEESNPLIFGYNEKGEPVDLQGNVVDFSKYMNSSMFVDKIAPVEAYTETVGAHGEDPGYTVSHGKRVFNVKTGKFQDESDANIVGYNQFGEPVYNRTYENKVIKEAVDSILKESSLSPNEKAKIISDAAKKYGLDAKRLSEATGYSVEQVNAALALAEDKSSVAVKNLGKASDTTAVSVLNLSDSANTAANAMISASTVLSSATTGAAGATAKQAAAAAAAAAETARKAAIISNYVIGLINDTTLTGEQKSAALASTAATQGFSAAEISAATGYSLDTVNTVLSIGKASNTTTASSALSTSSNTSSAASAASTTSSTSSNTSSDTGGASSSSNITNNTSASTTSSTSEAATEASRADIIRSFISGLISSEYSPQEQMSMLAAAAGTHGVSADEISAATGYSLDAVSSVLAAGAAINNNSAVVNSGNVNNNTTVVNNNSTNDSQRYGRSGSEMDW